MIDGLAQFNALPEAEAERRLYSCFADHGWAALVAARRPFENVNAMLVAADAAWSEVSRDGWLRAFAAHPRIGESGGQEPRTSEREQRRVRQASAETLAAVAAENRRYEAKFGHVFLIAARGRSADEILAALRSRLDNDPAAELEVAALEQRKIAAFRLGEMIEA